MSASAERSELMYQSAGGRSKNKDLSCCLQGCAGEYVHHKCHPQDFTETHHNVRWLAVSIVSLDVNAESALMGLDESIGAAQSSLFLSIMSSVIAKLRTLVM